MSVCVAADIVCLSSCPLSVHKLLCAGAFSRYQVFTWSFEFGLKSIMKLLDVNRSKKDMVDGLHPCLNPGAPVPSEGARLPSAIIGSGNFARCIRVVRRFLRGVVRRKKDTDTRAYSRHIPFPPSRNVNFVLMANFMSVQNFLAAFVDQLNCADLVEPAWCHASAPAFAPSTPGWPAEVPEGARAFPDGDRTKGEQAGGLERADEGDCSQAQKCESIKALFRPDAKSSYLERITAVGPKLCTTVRRREDTANSRCLGGLGRRLTMACGFEGICLLYTKCTY